MNEVEITQKLREGLEARHKLFFVVTQQINAGCTLTSIIDCLDDSLIGDLVVSVQAFEVSRAKLIATQAFIDSLELKILQEISRNIMTGNEPSYIPDALNGLFGLLDNYLYLAIRQMIARDLVAKPVEYIQHQLPNLPLDRNNV